MGTLLYDPDCGFCTRSAQLLARWPVTCRIEPMTPARLAELAVDPARAAAEIPFVHATGEVAYGAAGIAAALRTSRADRSAPTGRLRAVAAALLRLAGRILASPGIAPVAARVYRWVAEHRHELPGGTVACALAPAPRVSPGGPPGAPSR